MQKAPTILNPFTIELIIEFIICNTTTVRDDAQIVILSRLAILYVQIFQLLQTQPFTIDRHTEIAQVNCVLGAGNFFHILMIAATTASRKRYGTRHCVTVICSATHFYLYGWLRYSTEWYLNPTIMKENCSEFSPKPFKSWMCVRIHIPTDENQFGSKYLIVCVC